MNKMTTEPTRTAKVNNDVVISRIQPLPTDTREKPLKEWNTLHIVMIKGRLMVTLNNQLINGATDISPDKGRIGLQAEGAEMEFRRIELIPIPRDE